MVNPALFMKSEYQVIFDDWLAIEDACDLSFHSISEEHQKHGYDYRVLCDIEMTANLSKRCHDCIILC